MRLFYDRTKLHNIRQGFAKCFYNIYNSAVTFQEAIKILTDSTKNQGIDGNFSDNVAYPEIMKLSSYPVGRMGILLYMFRVVPRAQLKKRVLECKRSKFVLLLCQQIYPISEATVHSCRHAPICTERTKGEGSRPAY